MTFFSELDFSMTDWLAVALLFVCWAGYSWYAYQASAKRPCLVSGLREQRKQWMLQMTRRDNRIVDATIVGNQLRGVTFFASTTVLILAALVSLLAASDQSINALSQITGAKPQSMAAWEFKVVLLIGMMIYAFFRFTWSLRQYKFLGVMVGATPSPNTDENKLARHAQRSAAVANIGAYSFNSGLRSYYYALGALTWFASPWLFTLSSVIVTVILYTREFYSNTVTELQP